MPVKAVCTALALLAWPGAAIAAEYRDSAGAFTMPYDETVWSITPGAEGEFSIACKAESCAGIVAGCSGSRLWVPLASVNRLTREFEATDTEKAIIEGLVAEKAATEKANRQPDADNGPPTVVKPYTLMHTRDGHPVYDSDYRVSLGGRWTRFLSFSTAARSYSIAMVCHVPEDALAVWRPRFDALIADFRPSPQPFWLRLLERLGL